jgi:DNA polymerase elongation subunit (family B)
MLEKRKKLDVQTIKKVYENTLQFQILEWYSKDIEYKASISLFGVSDKGHSVCFHIKNTKPCFYIKVADSFKMKDKDRLLDDIIERCDKKQRIIIKDDCKMVKKKIFYGFRGNDKSKFIKLVFKSTYGLFTMRKLLGGLTNVLKIELFEEKIDPILQFIHANKIGSVGWVEINLKNAVFNSMTRSQIEYDITKEDMKKIDRDDIAPFRQMSYDIECFSNIAGAFPQATNSKDVVFQIGTTFQTYGDTDISMEHILTLKDCDKLENKKAILDCCKSEKELLLKWKDLINEYDPDIIYGYNNHGFDDGYLSQRAIHNNINSEFLDFSRFYEISASPFKKTFSSSAYGTSYWNILSIPGRLNFDLLVYIQREFKLDSYKMDSVAKHFLKDKIKNGFSKNPVIGDKKLYLDEKNRKKILLGQSVLIKDSYNQIELGRVIEINDDNIVCENAISEEMDYTDYEILIETSKNPITPNMIFASYRENDSKKIKDVADYCIQDTRIPLYLVAKLNIFVNQIQMALVTHVPFKFLLERGQQIKVYSQIYKETLKRGYIIPTIHPVLGGFQGATVLTPEKGAYFNPVIVLDFASLYPTIIRAHNLCYSSIVLNEKYNNLEGFEYETIEWRDEHDMLKSYTFVKNNDSILPDLLKGLMDERNAVRKTMKGEKDEFKYMVKNGFQSALKVSANSIYGFLAAQSLQCTSISACVTAIGRRMIDTTKNFVDNNYKDLHTIYGDTDSVFIKHGGLKVDLQDEEGMKRNMEECYKIGEELAEKASKLFNKPILLEFEKVYLPLLLFGKKTYTGLMYEPPNATKHKRDDKGVVLKRRDNPNITKIVYQGIIDILFKWGEDGIPRALDYLSENIENILNNTIDLNNLIISKTYKSNYKNENVPHKILAERMRERDAGSAPAFNERVPYVFIDINDRKAPQYKKVEHPDFVREHNLQIDAVYYTEQIQNPVSQILETFLPEKQVAGIFKKHIRDYEIKKSGQQKLDGFLIPIEKKIKLIKHI